MRGWRRNGGRSTASRLVLILSAAGLAAGCSSGNVRLGETPLFAASNPAGSELAPIESGDLPPVAARRDAAGSASIEAEGWTAEDAPLVTVGPADTAQSLSQGFGVPVDIILKANGLGRPEDVRPGQRLIVPVRATADPPARPTALAATAEETEAERRLGAPPTTLDDQVDERRHVVRSGETLWSIAKAYGVAPEAVIRLNGLPQDGKVRMGETLRIPRADGSPGGTRAQETEVAAIAGDTATDAAPESAPQAEPAVPRTDAAAPRRETASLTPPAATTGRATATGFRWPVRGRIITGFGKQADGARNEGINLAVPAGTPVHAAEAGTVIYAGNELEGYGNLILIQHEDDWVSAYAHNEALRVSRGDKVERGQTIASVGATGSVDRPQLHFELRKASKPVDPLPHLADG